MIDSLPLGLSEQDRNIVLEILRTQLPNRPVHAFGSRALGTARRRSDLDLAIGGTTPLSLLQRALLCEAFSESDLPIQVDIVDLNAITPEFRQRIERDFVPIQHGVLSEAVTP
jgi:predicted nucleotidyltransferase